MTSGGAVPGESAGWQALAARAHAFSQARQPAQAEAVLRQLLDLRPQDPGAIYQLAHCISVQGRPAQALEVLDTPVSHGHARCNRLAIDCLISLWRFPEGWKLFGRAIEASRTPSDIAELLVSSGRLFGKGERFQAAMRHAHARLAALAAPAPVALLCSLFCGMEDFARLKALLDRVTPGSIPAPLERCARAALGELPTGPRIFGIGLSRTGTTSLNNALRMLGMDAHHWLHPLTNHMLDEADVPLFEAQTDGWPSAHFETLANSDPQALFIFTDRDTASWHRSYTKHTKLRFSVESIEDLQAHLRDESRPCPHGEPWRQLHAAIYGAHDTFPEAFEAHRSRVLEFFADEPQRMLHLPVEHPNPWEALCGFLGKPVPQQPYPHRNRGL